MKVIMPQLGETVNEGTIGVWYKKVGDSVSKDEALLDVETDKAAVEVPVPVSGVISAINVEAGETVDVGTVLAVIDVAGVAEIAEDEQGELETTVETTIETNAIEPAGEITAGTATAVGRSGAMLSPAVRRLVSQHDLDVSSIPGTGKKGRTTRQDVLAYVAACGSSDKASPTTMLTPMQPMADKLIPFDRIRKLTAEHMVTSKATSPHVLQAVEVDYSAVDSARKQLGAAWKAEKGYSLTYLPFISKAIVLAIQEFPRINSSIDGDALQLHAQINLAIAVDLNFEGLVAPVVKDCGAKSVAEIAEGIRTLSQKAHANKLHPDDFAGGTYTISNSGPFGTLLTAPVINQPQVAIMSTDGIRKRPVVIESEQVDSIAIRPVGILAQSFDHRAFDGAYSAAFLNRVREILQQTNWVTEF